MQIKKRTAQPFRKPLMLAVLAMSATLSFGQPFGVLTYNIRLDTEQDGVNRWDNRKESMVELVNRYSPAIFGVQEALYHQVCYLHWRWQRRWEESRRIQRYFLRQHQA